MSVYVCLRVGKYYVKNCDGWNATKPKGFFFYIFVNVEKVQALGKLISIFRFKTKA